LLRVGRWVLLMRARHLLRSMDTGGRGRDKVFLREEISASVRPQERWKRGLDMVYVCARCRGVLPLRTGNLLKWYTAAVGRKDREPVRGKRDKARAKVLCGVPRKSP
jgi:hypothetical protein